MFQIPIFSYANAGGILSGENGTSGPPGTTGGINNVISQQGIKNLVLLTLGQTRCFYNRI